MGRTLKSVTAAERTKLTVSVFERLLSSVVKGNWKPCDRISPERDLCQQLGIARTSLREALKAMELVACWIAVLATVPFFAFDQSF